MTQELGNLDGDLILSFCQKFISGYPNTWPPDEKTLASEFVSHFDSFRFVTMGELKKFCLATGVKITEKRLDYDFLAVNYSFNGEKNIHLDDRPQNLLIQPHTILHEIREFLEYTFCELGSPILDSDEIETREMRANEFALLVMLSGFQREIAGSIENALEIRPGLLKFGAFVLIGAEAIALVAYAWLGTIYPHLPSQQTESRPVNVT